MTETFYKTLSESIKKVKEEFADGSKLNATWQAQSNICCPWHKQKEQKHKGRFGLMDECLDCMEQIESGYCAIDVKNFEFNSHWPIKKFWDKVEIKGYDECWPWTGAMRKDGKETAAYMLSPFHSGKIQSAARAAFWTSRGYTGRMRVFHAPGCDVTCCNPLHLRLRELESAPTPPRIAEINLSYGNIFDHARANRI
jgi:hypothetical protein